MITDQDILRQKGAAGTRLIQPGKTEAHSTLQTEEEKGKWGIEGKCTGQG